MAEKILDSVQAGTTRSSCYLASISGNDSLELVWKNGQTDVQVQGGSSSSVTRKTPSFDGYSINPSHAQKAIGEEVCIAKSARLSTSYDFPAERDSERDSSQRNSHQSNDQNSCQLKESKLTATGNSYLCTSSTPQYCQCLPSAPHKKPRMDSSHTPTTNSLKRDLGKANYFSNVLKPSLFLKSTYYMGNSTTLSTNNNTVFERVEEIKASKVAKAAAAAASSKAPDHDHSAAIDSSSGSSHGLTRLQGLKPLISDAPKPVPFVTRSQEIPPDEQSETVGHNSALRIHGSHGQYYNQTSKSAGLKAKGKARDNNYYDEPLPESSSVCSHGASNNTNLCGRKHDDTDDPTYSTDNDEEPEDVVKVKVARKGTGVKRSRNTELHSLYERKRRDKINKKMRILKELIPNCNKKDKASMLDDAIEYLKTLKFQLQIMSMGLCMPLMMLPTTTHHMINTPYLPHLMGAGIGFRPGTGIPCSLPQFPIASLPGINDNGVRMFGFPNQVPPMPISHAPFIPMVGNPSIQPLLATSTATKLAENQASARTHVLINGQAEYVTKQALNQGTNFNFFSKH